MPDGELADWDIIGGQRSVAVVARTTDGMFVTAQQFRPGPAMVLNELPGGDVDAGEEVGVAAARELLEETGFRAGNIAVVGSSWLGGRAELEKFCVVADECVPYDRPEPGRLEFINVSLKSLPEFLDLVRSGKLTDAAAAYRGLDWLNLLGPDASSS